ncbi:MAG: stealth family protein [Micrococcales bacterium]|nr:stealth family protein [Micrococcales bacterium]
MADLVPESVRRKVIKAAPDSLWRVMGPVVHGTTAPQQRLRRLRSRRVLSRVPKRIRGEAIPIAHGAHNWLAHPVQAFLSTDVLAAHLDLVADALEADGIHYVVIDAATNRRRLVAVSERDADRARAALTKHLTDQGVYYARVAGGRARRRGIIGHQTIPANWDELRIFRALATPGGVLLGGDELGCDLQFWRETDHDESPGPAGESMPAGTWVAPAPNRWFDMIQPDQRTTTDRAVDGTPRPMLASLTAPHAESVTFPIDVVYTWVDGDDPDWRRRKAEALKQASGLGRINPLAQNPSRYTSRDELRYSMRSLDMYAGWVGHVYLVTDDQVPTWLDTTHPKLTVVSHPELFGPRGRLPTFNSHAIESQLHHIEGLAEHFLYLNDDVFFGRPVVPEQFVLSNGLSLFFLSAAKLSLGDPSPQDWPVMAAGKRNRALIDVRFGHQITNKLQHVSHSLRRSVLRDIEETFRAEHRDTAMAQFRSDRDIAIPSSLAHYYGYFTGRAVPGTIRYLYADIAMTDTPDRLASLLRRRNFDVFCLNDMDSSTVDPLHQSTMLRDFLESYFPLPSSFERRDDVDGLPAAGPG